MMPSGGQGGHSGIFVLHPLLRLERRLLSGSLPVMAEIENPKGPMANTGVAPKSLFQKVLDGIETLGNKVPHPAVLFLLLIIILMVFSQLFQWLGISVTHQRINLETLEIEEACPRARR
jgi:hypothetical protein